MSGNFHIAAGKSVPLMQGHAHLTTLFDDAQANFSHRIDKFSFGESHGSIIQPLEGDEKIDFNANNKYQYFIEVLFLLFRAELCMAFYKAQIFLGFLFEV